MAKPSVPEQCRGPGWGNGCEESANSPQTQKDRGVFGSSQQPDPAIFGWTEKARAAQDFKGLCGKIGGIP
jgi:hypothetical protein